MSLKQHTRQAAFVYAVRLGKESDVCGNGRISVLEAKITPGRRRGDAVFNSIISCIFPIQNTKKVFQIVFSNFAGLVEAKTYEHHTDNNARSAMRSPQMGQGTYRNIGDT